MILVLPEQDNRVETGPIRFGDDWPGVFIRGDNALFYARSIQHAMNRLSAQGVDFADQALFADQVLINYLGSLVKVLRSCDLSSSAEEPNQ